MGESMITSFDGTKLYLKKETAADNKAVIVIVHGLCEHQGRYDYFAEKLHEAGIGTYRFDHRGHGRSEGEETFYSDFNELLDDTNVVVDMAIEENPDIPVFLLGHSMGGFTVSLYGAKYPDKKLRGIITSGALTADNGNLIRGVPGEMDVHMRLANQLGSGVCSVQEVVDWYGKDPYNKQSFTAGLCYAICDGLDWFKEKMLIGLVGIVWFVLRQIHGARRQAADPSKQPPLLNLSVLKQLDHHAHMAWRQHHRRAHG